MKASLPRKSIGILVASILILLLDEALVRAMAHGHVAHVLLGAGSGTPPLGAALLALALVVVRVLAVVAVPGALLMSAVGFAAHYFVGGGGSADSTSTGYSTGASIGVRGTQ